MRNDIASNNMIEIANTNMIDDIGLGRLLDNNCRWMFDLMQKTTRVLYNAYDDIEADFVAAPDITGIIGATFEQPQKDDIIFDDDDITAFENEPNENGMIKGY